MMYDHALQETVLGSISAVVLFSLATGLANSANSANEYTNLGIYHPEALIMSAQATAVS
jgi:hypothetical protein